MTKVKPSSRINWNAHVVYAVASGNYTTLHFRNGTSVLVSYTLKLVQERFSDLIRVHKNAAVRRDFIKRFRHTPAEREMVIWLKDGTALDVARRRSREIAQLLETKQPERA